MVGIASISSLWSFLWWSFWLKVSKACPCSDPSVCFASSSWPNPGSLWTTSWQSWPIPSAPCPIWPSSFALLSSSSLWWACNSLAKTTPTKSVKNGNVTSLGELWKLHSDNALCISNGCSFKTIYVQFSLHLGAAKICLKEFRCFAYLYCVLMFQVELHWFHA